MAATKRMLAAKCPTDALALTNKVFCAPGFFSTDVKHVRISPVASGGNFLYSIAEQPDVVRVVNWTFWLSQLSRCRFRSCPRDDISSQRAVYRRATSWPSTRSSASG